MSQKWITIAPIHDFWRKPARLPFAISDDVSIVNIPAGLRDKDEHDLLRPELAEAIEHTEYCFLVNYNAEALDRSQIEASFKIYFAYVALWLVKATRLRFEELIHIHEEHGYLVRQIMKVDPFLTSANNCDAEYSDDDFASSKPLYEALQKLKPGSTVHTALQASIKGLTENTWEWRFLFLWIALEALFGSSSEINFRLSQRISLFLGNTPETARAIFRSTKESYGYRCKVVHGINLAPKLTEGMSEVLMDDLDSLLRRALTKILSNSKLLHVFESKNRESYLDELAFNGIGE